jgi:galactose-6-phosphate isomerase
MPQLDPGSVVLFSPMFQTSFSVIRRVQGVDNNGRMTETDTTFPALGVIHAAGENTQERPKDYATGRKSIAVYTQFRLRPQTEGYVPDLVVYRGDNYLVQTMEDYTDFGEGWVQAYCTSQDLQDAPPQGTAINPNAARRLKNGH